CSTARESKCKSVHDHRRQTRSTLGSSHDAHPACDLDWYDHLHLFHRSTTEIHCPGHYHSAGLGYWPSRLSSHEHRGGGSGNHTVDRADLTVAQQQGRGHHEL